MKRKILFLDTTLRDGEQTPGVHFSVSQKLDIASRLSVLGVDIIEAGFPAASPGDREAVAAIAKNVEGPVVCALARANRGDIDAASAALSEAKRSRIHVFIATSDIHLRDKLKISREEALEKIRDSILYAASISKDVQFSAEDATRSDREFLAKAVSLAIDCGASTINIPDTVGYVYPDEYKNLIEYLYRSVPSIKEKNIVLSTHCHNDLGLATANSIAAASAGAGQIECTIGGVGERAGNAALEEIAVALSVKESTLGLTHSLDNREIIRTGRLVASVTGIAPPPNKSVLGANAFSHASGIHQHGMMNNSQTYQIISPEDVGLNSSTMILGKLSGKHAFAERVSELGYTLDENGLGATFARFKEVADKKSQMTDEDVRAIVGEYLDGLEGRFRLSSFQIQSGNKIKAMALISLSSPEGEVSEAAPGEGPVDAVFNAINRIADATDRLELISYGISAVTEGADALGEAKVKVRDGDATYTGRGVSTDIIKASIKAYLAAVNKWISDCEAKRAEA